MLHVHVPSPPLPRLTRADPYPDVCAPRFYCLRTSSWRRKGRILSHSGSGIDRLFLYMTLKSFRCIKLIIIVMWYFTIVVSYV